MIATELKKQNPLVGGVGEKRVGEVSFGRCLLQEQKRHISSAEREKGREEGMGLGWHSHGCGLLRMVSRRPDDGKSVLKRCRQSARDDGQTGKVATKGMDTERRKQKPGREENTQIRNMYPTH